MDEQREKILIVDDEPMVLAVANNILKDRYDVVCAESAEDGVRVCNEAQPDLILTDLYMPAMSGLDMVDILRTEFDFHAPVIFMTGMDDDTAETRVFHMGAEDFLKKPFRADVLLYRIDKVLTNRARIKELTRESTTDGLTGFLNKISVERKLAESCRYDNGVLAILDLDNFKLVNDLHGHEAGDRILVDFAALLKKNTRADDIVGRIGGDEFIVFFKDISDEGTVANIVARLNEQIHSATSMVLHDNVDIPLGVSAGAVIVPHSGTDYAELFKKADKAVYYVKQHGKRACSVYQETADGEAFSTSDPEDIQKLSLILGERTVSNHALWLGQSAFGYIYRYMLRYMQRYQSTAYKVLFTIVFMSSDILPAEFAVITEHLGDILKNSLRNSDIMMQSAPNQFFLLLPGVTESVIQRVIDRTISAWDRSDYHDKAQVFYEAEQIVSDQDASGNTIRSGGDETRINNWVAVIDDDLAVLRKADQLLSRHGLTVTTLSSGEELLEFTTEKRPDVILLDYDMPELDGAAALIRLREAEKQANTGETPVILMADSDEQESEAAALIPDATDIIRKPFISEILIHRVRQAIELARLRRDS
ncbi:MAG: response regulator [Lachnospiraceae bacterium]|nr:response regulator [Lachnospiraceae bacterium]